MINRKYDVFKKSALSAVITGLVVWSAQGVAADWDGLPVPADAGPGKVWQLHPLSDDFNYSAPAIGKSQTFFERWDEGFINPWLGPGLTEYYAPNSYVQGGELIIKASRKPGTNKVHTGAIHSQQSVQYPLYMEARATFTNLTLANAFWLLSSDSSQEIDVIEAYGSDRSGEEWFDTRMHLSHHVFAFNPWRDYQPKDGGSWVPLPSGESWRNDYHTIGVYWRDPWHLEYYVNGELARTVSGPDIIDPYGYTGGTGLSKQMEVIFDAEHQPWRDDQGTYPPTDAELADESRNKFRIDWVRFYKPVAGTTPSPAPSPAPAPAPTPSPATSPSPAPSGPVTEVEFGDFIRTGKQGAAIDSDSVVGFNKNGDNINYNTAGDYADYSMPLAEDGKYRIELDAASSVNGDLNADMTVDGFYVGSIAISPTGGWENYQTFALADTLDIGAGVHELRIQSAGGSDWQWNGDNIRFVKVGEMSSTPAPTPAPTPSPSPMPTPIVVQAENYSRTGGAYEGFQTYTTNGVAGVNYNQRGDWLEYSISVPQVADYSFNAYVATPEQGSALEVVVDGSDVYRMSVSSTNGWDNFSAQSMSQPIALSAGQHTLRVRSAGNTSNTWEWNADRFVLTPQ